MTHPVNMTISNPLFIFNKILKFSFALLHWRLKNEAQKQKAQIFWPFVSGAKAQTDG